MRIGIFILMAGREAGGPEIYEVELLRALARLNHHDEFFIYCHGAEAIPAIGIEQANFTYRVLRPRIRALSMTVTLPVLLQADRVDLMHATFTPPPLVTKPLVFTMHCVSNFERPEFYSRTAAWRLNTLQRIGINKARVVLCVSQTLREEVHVKFGLPYDRMLVSYNGVGPQFKPRDRNAARALIAARLGIDYRFILYVGKIQARKNLVRLIEAYARYRQQCADPAKLLLVGHRNAAGEDLDAAIERCGVRGNVIEYGYMAHPAANTESLLPVLYNAAEIFVFPSLWEGFGIPIVEAMASGVPVICSNVTCLPEVAGDAALIVDPLSSEDLAAAMLKVAATPALRADLAQRGIERARIFDWDTCASSTMAAYTRCARLVAAVG